MNYFQPRYCDTLTKNDKVRLKIIPKRPRDLFYSWKCFWKGNESEQIIFVEAELEMIPLQQLPCLFLVCTKQGSSPSQLCALHSLHRMKIGQLLCDPADFGFSFHNCSATLVLHPQFPLIFFGKIIENYFAKKLNGNQCFKEP